MHLITFQRDLRISAYIIIIIIILAVILCELRVQLLQVI